MVFDTMVIAYALLHTPGLGEDSLKALQKAEEIWVPDLFRSEFLNVLWQWVKTGQVPLQVAKQILVDVDGLLTGVVPANLLWERALEFAVAKRHPTYDMLFVALAAETGSRLVTYDRRLRELCPEYVISVPAFLQQ